MIHDLFNDLFNDGVSSSDDIGPNGRTTDELEGMQKEAVMLYCKALFRHWL
jgi:hypothetical protein